MILICEFINSLNKKLGVTGLPAETLCRQVAGCGLRVASYVLRACLPKLCVGRLRVTCCMLRVRFGFQLITLGTCNFSALITLGTFNSMNSMNSSAFYELLVTHNFSALVTPGTFNSMNSMNSMNSQLLLHQIHFVN